MANSSNSRLYKRDECKLRSIFTQLLKSAGQQIQGTFTLNLFVVVFRDKVDEHLRFCKAEGITNANYFGNTVLHGLSAVRGSYL